MPRPRKPAVKIAKPETPQAASDLAKSFYGTADLKSDATKQYDAEKKAIIEYMTEHKLLDDDQGIVFEHADGTIAARYKLTEGRAINLRRASNDLLLWAADHNLLSISKTALDAFRGTREHAALCELMEPARGSESIEFIEL